MFSWPGPAAILISLHLARSLCTFAVFIALGGDAARSEPHSAPASRRGSRPAPAAAQTGLETAPVPAGKAPAGGKLLQHRNKSPPVGVSPKVWWPGGSSSGLRVRRWRFSSVCWSSGVPGVIPHGQPQLCSPAAGLKGGWRRLVLPPPSQALLHSHFCCCWGFGESFYRTRYFCGSYAPKNHSEYSEVRKNPHEFSSHWYFWHNLHCFRDCVPDR